MCCLSFQERSVELHISVEFVSSTKTNTIYKYSNKCKMELFQTVQKKLALLGYRQIYDDHHYNPFSMRSLLAITIFCSGIISISIFTIHSADNPGDFLDSFYLLTVLFTIFVSYLTTLFKMAKIFDFFDICGKIFDESKFYCIQMFKFIHKLSL